MGARSHGVIARGRMGNEGPGVVQVPVSRVESSVLCSGQLPRMRGGVAEDAGAGLAAWASAEGVRQPTIAGAS